VRDTEKAQDFAQQGVRVCPGDFAYPASLAKAFDGADQVLIVSVPKLGEEALRDHANAIQAAKQAGVKRILYTSHQGAALSSAFVPCRGHAETEGLLQESGVSYVSLRNGFYAESALFQLGGMKAAGKIAVPEDGLVSWTARADLAEAAVAALTLPGLFDGISPPLTSSAVLDFSDIAEIASEILDRPIPRETISDETFREGLLSRGLPAAMTEAIGTLYIASRAREFAVIDPALEKLLGRKPTSMKEVLRGFLSASDSRPHHAH